MNAPAKDKRELTLPEDYILSTDLAELERLVSDVQRRVAKAEGGIQS